MIIPIFYKIVAAPIPNTLVTKPAPIPLDVLQNITLIDTFTPVSTTPIKYSRTINSHAEKSAQAIVFSQEWINTTVFEVIRYIINPPTTKPSLTRHLETLLSQNHNRHFLAQKTLSTLLILSKLDWNPINFTLSHATTTSLLHLLIFDQLKNLYKVDNTTIYAQCKKILADIFPQSKTAYFEASHIENSGVINPITLLALVINNRLIKANTETPPPEFFTDCVNFSLACHCLSLDALSDFARALHGKKTEGSHTLVQKEFDQEHLKVIKEQLQSFKTSHDSRKKLADQYALLYEDPKAPEKACPYRRLSIRLLETLNVSSLQVR